MSSESQLLEALIRARIAIRESRNHDHRPHWAGVTCPSCGVDYRSVSSVDAAPRPQISPGRIHKASSAESILRHCLRTLGFTAQYKRGQLTGQQHLDLLEAVRVYARAWLRHEAEQFAKHYLDWKRDGLSMAVERASDWVEGPGGYLIEVERPGFFANVGRFFKRAKQFVRESIVAGVMSLLGPAPLSAKELDAAEREAQKQEQYFDRFHDEIKIKGAPGPKQPPLMIEPGKTMVIDIGGPPMTPGQFVARTESYGNAAWQSAQRINTNIAVRNGQFKVYRRILGIPKTEHCDDCPPLAAMGWQPMGSLPAIGETECNGLCLCHFEFAETPNSQPYKQGKYAPVAADDIHPLPETDEVVMIAEPPGQHINEPIAGPPKK